MHVVVQADTVEAYQNAIDYEGIDAHRYQQRMVRVSGVDEVAKTVDGRVKLTFGGKVVYVGGEGTDNADAEIVEVC